MKLNPYKNKTPEQLAWEAGYAQGIANALASKDAQRYRYLRDHCVQDVEPEGLLITHKQIVFQWYSPTWDRGQKQLPVSLDEAIDKCL